MDMADLFPARVRGLQAIYPEAHRALVDWGVWSRTLVGFERGIGRQGVWFQGKADENEAYGELEAEGEIQIVEAPACQERLDEEPEDGKRCYLLDERMHRPGGLGTEVRNALKIAYIKRYIPEFQYPRAAGCSPDAFCERIEEGLRFARRFI